MTQLFPYLSLQSAPSSLKKQLKIKSSTSRQEGTRKQRKRSNSIHAIPLSASSRKHKKSLYSHENVSKRRPKSGNDSFQISCRKAPVHFDPMGLKSRIDRRNNGRTQKAPRASSNKRGTSLVHAIRNAAQCAYYGAQTDSVSDPLSSEAAWGHQHKSLPPLATNLSDNAHFDSSGQSVNESSAPLHSSSSSPNYDYIDPDAQDMLDSLNSFTSRNVQCDDSTIPSRLAETPSTSSSSRLSTITVDAFTSRIQFGVTKKRLPKLNTLGKRNPVIIVQAPTPEVQSSPFKVIPCC